ncbi:MAG: hypothetical protein WC956_06525 [bacterium]
MQKSQSSACRNARTIIASVRITLDEALLDISCDALEDICAQYKIESSEEALKHREIDQMHDALTFIRSGILNFQNVEDENGNRIVAINIAL